MIMLNVPQPIFSVGELVRHRRYGYRGVVVGIDLTCQADDAWYEANRTQPSRQQPWYHVLVHGGGHATYPAQDSLEADPSAAPIDHPLVAKFFRALLDGRYVPHGG